MTREEEIQKSYSRLHNIWHGMKQRCLNENAIDRNINGRVFINGRKIEKCDKNGKHICYYNSITDAIKANDCGRHISDVCLGKRKSCGGYVWKYID